MLAIRVRGEHHWALAVVRWASCGSRDTLMIGLQLIAPYAQSAMAGCAQWDHDENGIGVATINRSERALFHYCAERYFLKLRGD